MTTASEAIEMHPTTQAATMIENALVMMRENNQQTAFKLTDFAIATRWMENLEVQPQELKEMVGDNTAGVCNILAALALAMAQAGAEGSELGVSVRTYQGLLALIPESDTSTRERALNNYNNIRERFMASQEA